MSGREGKEIRQFKDINWEEISNLRGEHITINKIPHDERKEETLPERVHIITKKEIKNDDKREMKNCVRNFFYIREEYEDRK